MLAANAIETLFKTYHAQPLAMMREIGIQARLHSLLQSDLSQETCRAQVRFGDGGKEPQPTGFLIERVQMEVRVTDDEGRGPKKSDIVILRSTRSPEAPPITATRYANGPFDIVSKLCLADVAAVIEIKAACSADFSARHSFRLDLAKLLELAAACDEGQAHPELHFVLIDKSVALTHAGESYGACVVQEHTRAQKDWHVETEASLAGQTLRGRIEFWNGGGDKGRPRSPRMALLDQPPVGTPFVHVWQFDHDASGVATTDDPLHRYAVRSPSA